MLLAISMHCSGVGADLSDEFALCKFTHLAVEPKAKRPNTAKATQLLTSVVSMSTPTTKVVIIRYAAVIVSIVASRERRLPNEETFPVYTSSRILDTCVYCFDFCILSQY